MLRYLKVASAQRRQSMVHAHDKTGLLGDMTRHEAYRTVQSLRGSSVVHIRTTIATLTHQAGDVPP